MKTKTTKKNAKTQSPKTTKKAPTKKTAKTGASDRLKKLAKEIKPKTINGFSVASVLRALGKAEWTGGEAAALLKILKVEVKQCTIYTQVSCGFRGTRAKPAPIAKSQINEWAKMIAA